MGREVSFRQAWGKGWQVGPIVTKSERNTRGPDTKIDTEPDGEDVRLKDIIWKTGINKQEKEDNNENLDCRLLTPSHSPHLVFISSLLPSSTSISLVPPFSSYFSPSFILIQIPSHTLIPIPLSTNPFPLTLLTLTPLPLSSPHLTPLYTLSSPSTALSSLVSFPSPHFTSFSSLLFCLSCLSVYLSVWLTKSFTPSHSTKLSSVRVISIQEGWGGRQREKRRKEIGNKIGREGGKARREGCKRDIPRWMEKGRRRWEEWVKWQQEEGEFKKGERERKKVERKRNWNGKRKRKKSANERDMKEDWSEGARKWNWKRGGSVRVRW